MLYSKAREYVLSGGFGDVAGSKPVIYDLYTGTGTIAQMLSPVACSWISSGTIALPARIFGSPT